MDRIFRAFMYSLAGLKQTFINETAFKQEVFCSFIIIPLGFYLGEYSIEQAILIGSWILVMIVELINSSIETTVNRISTEQHKLSGQAKDIASAAVFIAILNGIIIWAIILKDKICNLITTF